MSPPIFAPMIVLVALTAGVWVLMYWRRLNEIHQGGIDPQSLATREAADACLNNVSAADNFSNLLETPILFYVLCIALHVTGEANAWQIGLAWIYVALRALHSFIHVTYNRVVQRWAVYVASTILLFVMWGNFAVALWRGA